MNENITISDVVEHAFCPKFTYFGKVLQIPEHEEKRGSVIKGKSLHATKEVENKKYVPAKIPNGTKFSELQLHSSKHGFVGKIDQLVDSGDQIYLIEVKYARPFIGKTLLMQVGLQATLVEESLGKPCRSALVEFVQNGRRTISLDITEEVKKSAIQELEATKQVVARETMPFSKYSRRCDDCCYRRICPVALLKMDQ